MTEDMLVAAHETRIMPAISQPAPEEPATQHGQPEGINGTLEQRYRELPLLDREIFERLSAVLPRSTVQEIYRTCISQTLERCDKVKRAIKRKNWTAVHDAAHAIGGSAAMVGAVRMAALARQLEARCCAAAPLEQTVAELSRCCREFSTELGKEGSPV